MSINATSTLGPPPSQPTYQANPSKASTVSEPTMTLAEKREIHNAKVGASTWAIFYGPLKPIWDFLFYNPSKAAKKRLDVRSGERSELSGEALEKEKKNAQLKASCTSFLWLSILTRNKAIGLIGLITPLSYIFFEKPESPDFNQKL